MAEKPRTYCEAVAQMQHPNVHIEYHDTEYGFPIESDNQLFGRLILEINQAGLSWTTILNKKAHFHRAYSGFDIQTVANYSDLDRQRLLQDEGIIRNRLKVEAAIHNAQKILDLQAQHGSFKNWLDTHHPKSKQEWVKLFKKTFRFTGGEITNEFLMSTGYLPGAHDASCPVYHRLVQEKPKWMEVKKGQ